MEDKEENFQQMDQLTIKDILISLKTQKDFLGSDFFDFENKIPITKIVCPYWTEQMNDLWFHFGLVLVATPNFFNEDSRINCRVLILMNLSKKPIKMRLSTIILRNIFTVDLVPITV